MSLQRVDNRAAAEVAGANAIGPTLLQTSLLPAPFYTQKEDLMQEYPAMSWQRIKQF